MYDKNMGEKKIDPKYKEPSVFEYHDYRDFLKAWCDFQKAYRGLSLREIAKQVECEAMQAQPSTNQKYNHDS